jgi:hypothetical protein
MTSSILATGLAYLVLGPSHRRLLLSHLFFGAWQLLILIFCHNVRGFIVNCRILIVLTLGGSLFGRLLWREVIILVALLLHAAQRVLIVLVMVRVVIIASLRVIIVTVVVIKIFTFSFIIGFSFFSSFFAGVFVRSLLAN